MLRWNDAGWSPSQRPAGFFRRQQAKLVSVLFLTLDLSHKEEHVTQKNTSVHHKNDGSYLINQVMGWLNVIDMGMGLSQNGEYIYNIYNIYVFLCIHHNCHNLWLVSARQSVLTGKSLIFVKNSNRSDPRTYVISPNGCSYGLKPGYSYDPSYT